jgi:hypothetical protein
VWGREAAGVASCETTRGHFFRRPPSQSFNMGQLVLPHNRVSKSTPLRTASAVVEHSNPDTCWLLHHELVCCVYTLSEILFCFGIVERAS